MEDTIRSMVLDSLILAKQRFPKFRLTNPKIEFFRNSKSAGSANAFFNRLRFNLDYAEAYPKEFRMTIIHEVSHLVVDCLYPYAKQAHGPEFRFVCVTLGGTGKTHHNYQLPSKTIMHIVFCECRMHQISENQYLQFKSGSKLICKYCQMPVYE